MEKFLFLLNIKGCSVSLITGTGGYKHNMLHALPLQAIFLGLQMTDVDLDVRLTALEENGGGNNQNGNKTRMPTAVAVCLSAC